jgi:hypothetical protein
MPTVDPRLAVLRKFGEKRDRLTVEDARVLISITTNFFCDHLVASGYEPSKVRAIVTKFRDAGRRSPPWRPASARVPGRPQDGADGNRRLRWLFDDDHKFYADELTATLVEVRYYLQALSMLNAPPVPPNTIQDSFTWLTGHRIEPGAYVDPLQLEPIDLKEFIEDRRYVESGHIVPLDRGGKHVPSNAFLSLARSNKLQGNLTFDELLELMEKIVDKHKTSVKAEEELLRT